MRSVTYYNFRKTLPIYANKEKNYFGIPYSIYQKFQKHDYADLEDMKKWILININYQSGMTCNRGDVDVHSNTNFHPLLISDR